MVACLQRRPVAARAAWLAEMIDPGHPDWPAANPSLVTIHIPATCAMAQDRRQSALKVSCGSAPDGAGPMDTFY